MNTIDIIGHVGSFLSSITFLPQVYKTWKTKSAGDLSTTMMLIVTTSTLVWLAYGIWHEPEPLMPVIICNAIICFLSLLLLYFKFTFKKPS